MKKQHFFHLFYFVFFLGFAQTKLPSFFTSNMVLEQEENVAIWGFDVPNKKIKITTSWGEKGKAIADKNGDWNAVIKTPSASFKEQTISIKGSTEIKLNKVLIGEVWFCSGQSNMEMPLKGFQESPVNNSDVFISGSDNLFIRLFNAERSASLTPEKNIKGKWEIANPKSASEFSAIGYLFGLKLFQKLKIPIGIIESSWGGTRIETWLPKDSLLQYASVKVPEIFYEIESKPKQPSFLYNAMIHPFKNYKVKGFLWYQGETNRTDPEPYKKYMHTLVNSWRSQWLDQEMPFYFVQIAPYAYFQYRETPVINANLIREAQSMAAQEIPHSEIVITSDVGKCDDIHPPEKEKIANRLANIALAKQYNFKEIAYQSPVYTMMKINNEKIVLTFDFGKVSKENRKFNTEKSINSFEIAGKDQMFYPAKAFINNDQTITVYCDKVKNPVAVRYGFEDCLDASLFSLAGLAVSPFRTDNWAE
jgi:sialate O-acetylesterase